MSSGKHGNIKQILAAEKTWSMIAKRILMPVSRAGIFAQQRSSSESPAEIFRLKNDLSI